MGQKVSVKRGYQWNDDETDVVDTGWFIAQDPCSVVGDTRAAALLVSELQKAIMYISFNEWKEDVAKTGEAIEELWKEVP